MCICLQGFFTLNQAGDFYRAVGKKLQIVLTIPPGGVQFSLWQGVIPRLGHSDRATPRNSSEIIPTERSCALSKNFSQRKKTRNKHRHNYQRTPPKELLRYIPILRKLGLVKKGKKMPIECIDAARHKIKVFFVDISIFM